MVRSLVAEPPSVLPDISPTRREIGWALSVCLKSINNLVWQVAMDFTRIVGEGVRVRLLPISPRVGEMPGRAEGGSASLLNKKGGTPC